jgi:hypothetical protein
MVLLVLKFELIVELFSKEVKYLKFVKELYHHLIQEDQENQTLMQKIKLQIENQTQTKIKIRQLKKLQNNF